jgi:hypothetical protein
MTTKQFNSRIKELQLKRDLTENPTSKKMWQDKIDILKGLDKIELNWL